MSFNVPQIDRQQFLSFLKKLVFHIAFVTAFILLLIAMDYCYATYVNPNYQLSLQKLNQGTLFWLFLTLLTLSFCPKWLTFIGLAVILALSATQLVVYQYFGTYIRPIHYIQLLPDFLLIAESFNEAIDEMYGVFLIILVAVGVFVFLLFAFLPRSVSSYWLILPLLGLLYWDSSTTYSSLNPKYGKISGRTTSRLLPRINRIGIDNAYRSLRYLLLGTLPKIYFGSGRVYPALPEPAVKTKGPDVNVILVISETLRASQLSILGYEAENTTPYLSQVEGLYARSIFSAATMTRTSFAGLMHRMKYPGIGPQYLRATNCLFRLAKKNNFKTHFIYGYSKESAQTLLPFMCETNIDTVRTIDDLPKKYRRYDKNILYDLNNLDFEKNNFVVLGLTGSHTPYNNKAPKPFRKFDSSYDNSVLYGDRVLSRIYEIVRKRSKKPTYVLFTSDHGELLKGESDVRGHGWFRKDVYTVPFLYKTFNIEDASSSKDVRSHFDFSTLALKLLGYDVEIETNASKEIYVNGSDLNGLAGQLRIKLENDKVIEEEKIRW